MMSKRRLVVVKREVEEKRRNELGRRSRNVLFLLLLLMLSRQCWFIFKSQNHKFSSGADSDMVSLFATLQPQQKIQQSTLSPFMGWPKSPPNSYGRRETSCKIIFQDKSMATCHLGAFGGNFGDMIGPDVVKRILEYHFPGCSAADLPVWDLDAKDDKYSNRTCLWSVGSVWRYVRPDDHVWGAGTHGTKREFVSPCGGGGIRSRLPTNIHVYSARGPGTISAIQHHCQGRVNLTDTLPRGDGGFLVPFLFPELNNASHSQLEDNITFDRCVIRHYYDEIKRAEEKTGIKTTTSFIAVLPVIQSWPTMIRNITRCRKLASSSLHGVIIGDAYGIPTRWVSANPNILPYKFRDYFDSFSSVLDGAGHWNHSFRTDKAALANNDTSTILGEDVRSRYAQDLLSTFPFPLFTAIPAKADEEVSDLARKPEDNDLVFL